jgi:hypothetical protein
MGAKNKGFSIRHIKVSMVVAVLTTIAVLNGMTGNISQSTSSGLTLEIIFTARA